MTTQLITSYFRLHNVNQFKESISETANSVYYIFAGKHTPYPSGDTTIPEITNNVNETLYNAYTEMVFGKRVTPSDVLPVAPRYNWTSNTKYAAYRSNEDLTDKQYYVCVNGGSAFHVFKCLDNNGNTASVIQPDVTQTTPDDTFYSTSDGYVWKYMYSMNSTVFNKFATTNYIPVVANTEVSGNAVSGAIDVITLSYAGSNYNSYLSNTFISTDLRVGGDPLKYNIANTASSSNNFYLNSFMYIVDGTGSGQGRKIVDYTVVGTSKTVTLSEAFTTSPDTTSQYEITPYVLISGDGDGAEARAIVNNSTSNTIHQIEIISRGQGYTYATAVVTGNTGGVSNAAVLEVVLGPKGGHGSNPEYELGCSALGISVSFANSESGTIPAVNDYRTVGLIKDPLFANVVLTVGSPTGAFNVGQIITQANTGAQGVVTEWDSINTLSLTNVSGIFLTGNSSVNLLTEAYSGSTATLASYQINGQAKSFSTFDQRYRFTFTPIDGVFTPDESVYQTDVQLANAVFHSNTSANVYLTHVLGTLNTGNAIIGQSSGASANLLFSYPPDLVIGSGEVLYVENENPISRSISQSETIKIILQF
jgi:hypothetical protein